MSAPFPMCRTAIWLVVLTTLTSGGVGEAQVSAKTHRKAPVTAGAGAMHRIATSASVHHARTARTSAAARRSKTKVTQKPTADQAGYTAGLAIRRRLEEQRTARANAAIRSGRSRTDLQAATYRNNSAKAIRVFRPSESAAAFGAATAPGAEDGEAQTQEPTPAWRRVERPSTRVPDEPASARAAAKPQQPVSDQGPDDGMAESVQTASSQTAPVREDNLTAVRDRAAEGAEEGDDPGDAAEASHLRRGSGASAKAEEASLRISRAGMPAPLYGTLASLQRQNSRLEEEGLERIEDDADLDSRIAHKLLVQVPVSSALTVNANLAANRRYCRPWTALFLADLARAHNAMFHRPIQVNSAVRTVEYQARLMETNGNAAPAEGDIVSPHLTGASVDIGKDGLSRSEIAWMRRRLLALEDEGKIDVEEEFRQACFHITVYKSYAPPKPERPAMEAAGSTHRSKRRLAPAVSVAASAGGL